MNQQDYPAKPFKTNLIQMAIDKEKTGYMPIADERVTDFWQKYYSFKNQHYPRLILNEVEGPRGTNARWPWFGTLSKSMAIAHKSNRGYVDLTLHGLAGKLNKIDVELSNLLDKDISLVKTSKSISIRIIVSKIDFESVFDAQLTQVRKSFEAVTRLFDLSKKIILDSY